MKKFQNPNFDKWNWLYKSNYFRLKLFGSRAIVTCQSERENTTETTMSKRYGMREYDQRYIAIEWLLVCVCEL